MSIDFGVDDGGDGVEEARGCLRRSAPGWPRPGPGEVRGPVATMTLSQSSGGRPAISSRTMVTSGWASSFAVTACGEAVAVDGQGAAGRHLVGVGAGHDDRVQRPHLGVQQADGVVLPVVGAEGVGADQLGQAVGVVGVGLDARHAAHLVQDRRARRRWAICQAASEPARPPPMTWIGERSVMRLLRHGNGVRQQASGRPVLSAAMIGRMLGEGA